MIAALEDSLSEAVVTKLIGAVRPDLAITTSLPKRGRTYIESRVRELNRTALAVPVLVVVDLDRPEPCPADLIRQFLAAEANPQLVFRVAVMEIESWIMADRETFAEFLGVPPHRIPPRTDEIPHPKELVVNLARRSRRRDIREDLVPSPGSTAAVGRAFNARLTLFVMQQWSPLRASEASESLRRSITRLESAFI